MEALTFHYVSLIPYLKLFAIQSGGNRPLKWPSLSGKLRPNFIAMLWKRMPRYVFLFLRILRAGSALKILRERV
jgi:hypothetical protein